MKIQKASPRFMAKDLPWKRTAMARARARSPLSPTMTLRLHASLLQALRCSQVPGRLMVTLTVVTVLLKRTSGVVDSNLSVCTCIYVYNRFLKNVNHILQKYCIFLKQVCQEGS